MASSVECQLEDSVLFSVEEGPCNKKKSSRMSVTSRAENYVRFLLVAALTANSAENGVCVVTSLSTFDFSFSKLNSVRSIISRKKI